MFMRLEEDARKAVLTAAADEAQRRGDRRLGTAHLLLGLLRDPSSEATRALGVDLVAARRAEAALDQAALAAVGISAGDLPPATASPDHADRLPPLSSGARQVLKRAIEQARPGKTGRIQARHFLLALLECSRPDPAAELLAALDVEAPLVRTRLSAGVQGI
jgi:ATP-dependent Clp protease ATP-binding subunit ClpA